MCTRVCHRSQFFPSTVCIAGGGTKAWQQVPLPIEDLTCPYDDQTNPTYINYWELPTGKKEKVLVKNFFQPPHFKRKTCAHIIPRQFLQYFTVIIRFFKKTLY